MKPFPTLATSVAAVALSAQATFAEPVPFDSAWAEQGLLRLSSNDYSPRGGRLGVRSDGTVSVFFRRLDPARWSGDTASWSWAVSEGVPATDLARKGGDDRNLALYFVFADDQTARELRGAPLRRLTGAEGVRVLVYTWGGSRARGTVFDNPYFDNRGATVILRPAGTGQHRETVDLTRDLKRAFGRAPEALIGVAVSADSDDTDTRIRARIDSLSID